MYALLTVSILHRARQDLKRLRCSILILMSVSTAELANPHVPLLPYLRNRQLLKNGSILSRLTRISSNKQKDSLEHSVYEPDTRGRQAHTHYAPHYLRLFCSAVIQCCLQTQYSHTTSKGAAPMPITRRR